MSIQQHILPQPQQTIEFTALTKTLCKNENVTPTNSKPQKRYGHLSFVWKGKLHVIGGSVHDSKNQSSTSEPNKSVIYCYSLQKSKSSTLDDKKAKKAPEQEEPKWEQIEAKLTPQAEAQFRHMSFSAFCIFPHKKRLYIFGGSTRDGKTSNNLFRLDLDTLQWSKPQQKGTIPKARQQASLSLFTKNEKNYLVLYGGANYENYEIYSDINLYQIETKYWFPCHSLSMNFLQPRISPAVCFEDNKIYVFGGYYVDVNLQKGYLNDLYEIQFNLSLEKGRPYAKSCVRRLDNTLIQQGENLFQPVQRCSSEMIIYNPDIERVSEKSTFKKESPKNQWIIIIGGQKSCDQKKKTITTLNDIWIFSLKERKWQPVETQTQFRSRSSFTSVLDRQSNKILIFGGLNSNESILNDIVSLKISGKQSKESIQNTEIMLEESQVINSESSNFSSSQINQICASISFPFSAIALIVDNFVNFKASFCDITYNINKNKNLAHNYIKFESNANFPMSNQTLLSHFMCLKAGIRTYVQGTDKKVKAQMKEDNLTREIGTNFVIGGLRLGDCIIFANLNPDTFEIMILIVLKTSSKPENENQQFYQCDYRHKVFDFTLSKEEILSQKILTLEKCTQQEKNKRQYFFQSLCPEQIRKRVESLCVQAVETIRKGGIKNIFYILKLKTLNGSPSTNTTKQSELQLFPDMMKNDIIFGDKEIIRQIQLQGISVYESMDVSLKNFISYLYMHGCETELTVSIQGMQRKPIIMQDYLLKVDEMLKNKQIVEISNEFEFDCKIIELYFISEKPEKNLVTSKNNYKFFGNGTLFYLKNRLIKRHGVNLGDYLYEYKLRSIRERKKERKSIILKNSNHYSIRQIFGHIEIPQAVPINITKTDYVFPVMLERIEQKLRQMEDQILKEKQIKANLKIKIVY